VCEKNGVDDTDTEVPQGEPAVAKKADSKRKPAHVTTPPPASAPSAKRSSGGMAAQVDTLPASWRSVLADEFQKSYFQQLEKFVDGERAAHTVFPPEPDVFNALKFTPYDDMKVLLLGQDPYHDDGQAHGLCFSVRPGIKAPPSLVNMFKELKDDLGCRIPNNGCLEPWARQGVLLLNAVLTVVAHKPNSHKGKGWETFSDAVIRKVNEKTTRVVFCLWGGYARKKAKLVDTSRHVVVEGAHPSPLSAKQFLGSRPFSAINRALVAEGKAPIEWQLPTSQP
jgi:uracil-DNA glycosylase